MRQKKQADTVRGTIWRTRAGAGLLAAFLACIPALLFYTESVQAASGTVYSCTINRCYAHPVTGVIEDPGGQASYVTGQGMVEGAVASAGMMEVTDSGAYYLTFRVGLVDYTSNHSFSVQNVGDSGWSAVTPTVTANGTDSNGTTSDLCIQVPSENCIVRGSMYVTPMGRDVIFYFYPNNYTEGNTTGMTASVVTERTDSGTDAGQTGTDGTSQAAADGTSQAVADENGQTDTDGAGQTGSDGTGQKTADGTGQTGTDGIGQTAADRTGQIGTDETSQAGINGIAGAGTGSRITGGIETAAVPASDAELNSAQGLSLSTAADVETVAAAENSTNSSLSVGSLIVAVTAAITISGLILMLTAACIVCYFRKNWRRWGGYDEEYEDEDA